MSTNGAVLALIAVCRAELTSGGVGAALDREHCQLAIAIAQMPTQRTEQNLIAEVGCKGDAR
jgi:hypothetical protein